ncbi:MAG: radical SAM protein [Candidatus Woesebacteria bacterium]|jgi:MoaA/NifB/PqqE/SkfB family radical SAM enzyme
MNKQVSNHFLNQLKHLYISPLELCNLNCKICYTAKTKHRLSKQEILNFIKRYQKVQVLETITFCGGELFLLDYFPALINQLTKQGLFIQIISNGTIDNLVEFKQANFINIIVSLDGLEAYHDLNRGKGNFKKSLNFLKKAKKLGFHLEVFSILTKENLTDIEKFEQFLKKELGFLPVITYHPRKPLTYLSQHPVSNRVGQIKGFSFLTEDEIRKLPQSKKIFPPTKLGCYQISLMADAKVYGCCEGIHTLGNKDDRIELLIKNLKKRLDNYFNKMTAEQVLEKKSCLGCVEKDFICGLF